MKINQTDFLNLITDWLQKFLPKEDKRLYIEFINIEESCRIQRLEFKAIVMSVTDYNNLTEGSDEKP